MSGVGAEHSTTLQVTYKGVPYDGPYPVVDTRGVFQYSSLEAVVYLDAGGGGTVGLVRINGPTAREAPTLEFDSDGLRMSGRVDLTQIGYHWSVDELTYSLLVAP